MGRMQPAGRQLDNTDLNDFIINVFLTKFCWWFSGTFPPLQARMKSIMAQEMEVVVKEEK